MREIYARAHRTLCNIRATINLLMLYNTNAHVELALTRVQLKIITNYIEDRRCRRRLPIYLQNAPSEQNVGD